MYLEKLGLTNFKCFPSAELRFGKITLLLGANSTGKSSLIHGVLAALQSDQFPLALSANGDLVNLGDFRAISHSRSVRNLVSISLEFSAHQLGGVAANGVFRHSDRTGMLELQAALITDPAFTVRVSRTDRYRAEWTYDAERDPIRRTFLESAASRPFLQALAQLVPRGRQHSAGTDSSQTQEPDTIDPFAVPPPSGRFVFTRPHDFFARIGNPRYILLTPHLAALANTFAEFRSTFNYIGSFRLEPQRSYYQVSRGDLKVQRDGTNYIEQIAYWEEHKARELLQLKQALRQLKLLSGLRTKRLRGGIFEVNVQPHRSTLAVSLADVGFGIGQVLPILVADLQLPKGSTLAISQPEIHLHPSVQADLADYLVRRTTAAKNRYIVETHSEYFVNRLRLLVAKDQVSSNDLSVLYLSNDGSKSTIHRLSFEPNGRIEGAPQDFFETYMVDVMNIAINATAK